MGENREVKNRILELMETISEGFIHIEKQLTELRYEDALVLLIDAMEGITAIGETLVTIQTEIPGKKMNLLLKDVLEAMEKVTSSYERNEESQVADLIINDIIPSFAKWKAEMERVLREPTS